MKWGISWDFREKSAVLIFLRVRPPDTWLWRFVPGIRRSEKRNFFPDPLSWRTSNRCSAIVGYVRATFRPRPKEPPVTKKFLQRTYTASPYKAQKHGTWQGLPHLIQKNICLNKDTVPVYANLWGMWGPRSRGENCLKGFDKVGSRCLSSSLCPNTPLFLIILSSAVCFKHITRCLWAIGKRGKPGAYSHIALVSTTHSATGW